MDLVLQLLTGFGPAILVAVAVTASLTGSRGHDYERWSWPVAILLLGVPVAVASFLEMRSAQEPQTVAQADVASTQAPALQTARPALQTARPERRQVQAAAQPGYRETVQLAYAQPRQTVRPHIEHMRNGNRMVYGRPAGGFIVRTSIGPMRIAQNKFQPISTWAPSTRIPPNTLSCTGFTRDAEGYWEAGDGTLPFNVGDETNVTVRSQGPIGPGWMTVGDGDLYTILNARCGKKQSGN
jgi:hypothetical protein